MIIPQLILAHLLGDFILQPNKWVADKEQRKVKSFYLYFHVLIHTFLAFVFLWNWELWWIALAIGFTHYIIDVCKLYFQKPKTKKMWFFIDQLLHVLAILALSFFANNFYLDFLENPNFIKIVAAAVFLTTPVSILIKILLSEWSPIIVEHSKIETESLTNAGKYIGILERLLVFTFIVINHWEGVGFMIAAKSVFRFSDLAEARQRKLTEYVLIGTLLSFGMAVFAGILIKI